MKTKKETGKDIVKRFLLIIPAAVLAAIVVVLGYVEVRQSKGNAKADAYITNFRFEPVKDLGSVETLKILPLIDFHTSDPGLETEVGVSYLVDVDGYKILFDVGHNALAESPSPLEKNMAALGVALSEIDMVFISHNHFDHVGGMEWQAQNSFSLGLKQAAFPRNTTRAVVPAKMRYPGLQPEFTRAPTALMPGVASTGVIPRQLIFGWIEEHSLVINVEGKGAVLIVGCGHQPVPNLIDRFEAAFDVPLYGVLGGLHLPVPEGRIPVGPFDGQRHFASGKGLLAPLTMNEVEQQIELLKSKQLGVVGVGGHDSSDEVIALISEEFGDRYQRIEVGRQIVIGRNEQ